MPFTVSHAAAVLPFRRLPLIWSAFIVGSMAPDFPYIAGSTQYRALGHRFPGVLLFAIPASFAALWLFHNVIKRPIIRLLPAGMQVRLRYQVVAPFRFAGPSHSFAILLSIMLGIATHIVWDSFTHARTWPWHHFSWLRGWFCIPVLGFVPKYEVLQYCSTFIGMLSLGVWIGMWYRRSQPGAAKSSPQSHYWLGLAIFAVAIVAGVIRAAFLVGISITRANVDNFLLVFGVTSLALAFWQLLLYCVLVSSYQVWIVA